MNEPIESWDDARVAALALSGTTDTTSYGAPAVMIKANGRTFLHTGGESDISFALALDDDSIAVLMETEPETYFKTPHYEGWPMVLVRYGSADPKRVRRQIEHARDQAAARSRVRKRKP